MKKEQTNARIDCLYQSLFNLDEALKSQKKEIRTLEFQLSCGVKTGHILSVEHKNGFRTSFRCIKCELFYGKNNQDLNEREKELVRIVLGEKNEDSETGS